MRNVVLVLGLLAAGCTQVDFKNPQTGSTRSCGRIMVVSDFNPWSSSQLCMESAVSAGYQRVR